MDYKKAFDSVQHNQLTELLKNIGIDSRDLRIITNIYYNQATVSVEGNVGNKTWSYRNVYSWPSCLTYTPKQSLKKQLVMKLAGIIVNKVIFTIYDNDIILLAGNIAISN